MVDISSLFNTTAQNAAAPNTLDAARNIAQNDAKNNYLQAQTSGAMTDQQQKLRGMQASMLGSLAQLPPDKYESAAPGVIAIANKINPSVQYDPSTDQQTAKMIAMGSVPVSDQPQYGMTQAMAGLFSRLGQQDQSQQGQTAPSVNGASAQAPQGLTMGGMPMSAGDQAMLAFAKPESLNAIVNAQKAQYESPAGKQATAEATKSGENIADAQKSVSGIDSRIQNAINILNDQIDLAPKTASGETTGKSRIALARNVVGLNLNSPDADLVKYQDQFEQNNSNLFTQELPAIISSIPGSRLDIPLVKAIKDASAIEEYGTPAEKINSAKNLKTLLYKYQQNTHEYAKGIGAGDIPIPEVQDKYAPQPSASQSNLPQKGAIEGGYIFMGGDPANPSSWKVAK